MSINTLNNKPTIKITIIKLSTNKITLIPWIWLANIWLEESTVTANKIGSRKSKILLKKKMRP